MIFAFDFQKWVLWLLPAVLRKPRTIAIIQAFIVPVKLLHTWFLSYRNMQNEIAKTTGQTIVLRGYLNRHFDPTEKRIYILDDLYLPPTFVYLESENRPLYLPAFIAASGGSDFVVYVPSSLIGQELQIKSAVNTFKLPSKIFRIEYF